MKQRLATLTGFLLFVMLSVSACSAGGSGQDGYAQQRHQTLQQLAKVIALNNQAIEFANGLPQFQQVSAANMAHLQSLWRATLVQAKKVNIAILNKEEPGFGNDFRDKFVKGLELCIGAGTKQNVEKGQLLLAAFGREFSAVRAKHTGGGR